MTTTADKKPEKYKDSTGKVKIRMVPVDKKVIKKDDKMETEVSVSETKKTDRWYKDQPEWGTPESDKKARQMTPGQSESYDDLDEISIKALSNKIKSNNLNKVAKVNNSDKIKKDLEAMRARLNMKPVKEEMTTTADAGIPQDTKTMGPKFKTTNVTDRRRRKDKHPILLKRFRKYTENNG